MSTLYELVSKVPHDDVLNLGFRGSVWRQLLDEVRAERSKHVLSTREAAEEFGYSHTYWKKWAAEGKIWTDADGERIVAWQDEAGAPWRLPYIACIAHLDRLRQRASKTGSKRRGPWKKRPRLIQDGEVS